MATLLNRRVTGILLQNALNDINAAVSPLYALANVWTLNGIDDDLPAEAEVKAVLENYANLQVPALNVRAALSDVAASTEEFDGLFAVPSTAFAYSFNFDGPVWTGQSAAQGFGVSLSVVRVALFVGASGTNGADLTVDLRIDGTSIFATLPSIPITSGANVHYLVPDSYLNTKTLPAESVLSAHLTAAPNDAEDLRVNVWLNQ